MAQPARSSSSMLPSWPAPHAWCSAVQPSSSCASTSGCERSAAAVASRPSSAEAISSVRPPEPALRKDASSASSGGAKTSSSGRGDSLIAAIAWSKPRSVGSPCTLTSTRPGLSPGTSAASPVGLIALITGRCAPSGAPKEMPSGPRIGNRTVTRPPSPPPIVAPSAPVVLRFAPPLRNDRARLAPTLEADSFLLLFCDGDVRCAPERRYTYSS